MIPNQSIPTVIVTGASRGLGAGIAQQAAWFGASVTLTARSEKALTEVARQIEAGGGRALVVPADVTQKEDCRRVVSQTVERFGGVDALVNNAGLLEPLARLEDIDPAAWQRNWEVNVLGVALMTEAALPHLRERRGRVVNVSSGAAVSPKIGWGAYCTTKAALNMFNMMLAAEEPDLTSLAVRPGLVDTAMQTQLREAGEPAMSQSDFQRFTTAHAEGKLNPPKVPGRVLAVLALAAPQEWSGKFIDWQDAPVQALVEEYTTT